MNKKKELLHLASLYKKNMWCDRDTRQKLEETKIPITRFGFYSTVPTLDEIDNAWEYHQDGPGFENKDLYDVDAMAEYVENVLYKHSHKFDPPKKKPTAEYFNFAWDNTQCSNCDAMLYFCLLSEIRPKRIVEVGAGHSTSVALNAIKINDLDTEMTVIDPIPSEQLQSLFGNFTYREQQLQSVPAEEIYNSLEANDVLFIDSTHTVKTGSDVIYYMFNIIPKLKKGVYVHIHDVYLPYPRPHERLLLHQLWWEDMLLHAFLLGNESVKVVYSVCPLVKEKKKVMKRLMHGRYPLDGYGLVFKIV